MKIEEYDLTQLCTAILERYKVTENELATLTKLVDAEYQDIFVEYFNDYLKSIVDDKCIIEDVTLYYGDSIIKARSDYRTDTIAVTSQGSFGSTLDIGFSFYTRKTIQLSGNRNVNCYLYLDTDDLMAYKNIELYLNI